MSRPDIIIFSYEGGTLFSTKSQTRYQSEFLFQIDGTQPRYRIKLDQSLQIITLHKTDSGIYLCTADNGIGDPITNEIKLDVLGK